MCGLVGAMCFGNGHFRITAPYLERMRDTMIHRGPDGHGVWVSEDGAVGLAHRRLSIIDLSMAASQPMANDDGTVQVVFNGEIYNHACLRSELDKRARVRWKTHHSDTEVIVRAYEHWGIDFLHHLRGMFAIAIWDAHERCLWLVRDRIGIKPLYFSFHHGRITFASEIKALLEDPDQTRAVDIESLHDYLLFMCTPHNKTIFSGIQKLEPGTLMRVTQEGQITVHRWYDVWNYVRPEVAAKDDMVYEQVLDVLTDSITLRKVADVPMGVFLSGGIDSSTNTVLFSRGLDRPVSTFSIGYQGQHQTYRNELDYARRVADFVGADYHERLLSADDLINFLPTMVHLQDEPIADPVCVPLYFVSKLARDKGVTVCQVGEGADELFWGYPQWQSWLRLQNVANLPMVHQFAGMLKWAMMLFRLDKRREFDVVVRASNEQPVFAGSAQGFTKAQSERILSEKYRSEFSGRGTWQVLEPIWSHFQDAALEPTVLNWMTYLELRIRLPEMLLMRVDKMAMGASLEARVPFLDHRLVELALSIPQSRRTRDRQSKHVLKQAVRGLIPDEIIDRPKQGFGVPIREWLFGRLGDQIRNDLKAFCKDNDYFDFRGIEHLLTSKSRVRVWYIYNFMLWHRHFIEGQVASTLLPS